jgi:tRNA modification GTPase
VSELTYAACLTPPGTGAIATIAVRGPAARQVVEKLFQASGGRKPSVWEDSSQRVRRFWLGKFGDELADEVVLIVKRLDPAPWLDLHCHGGREVVRLLLETLERHGVEVCSWQELERHNAARPSQAEAAILLVKAPTVRTAAILLDQYHGAFDLARQDILEALAREDHEPAARLLGQLARFLAVGRHLVVPWRVVVAGAPNVGKSSLVNALAGYQRSIVSAIPGTTRDVVSAALALDGWPVELVDTAGWQEGVEGLEREGIRLAEEAAAGADLCLWLLDGSAEKPFLPGATGVGGAVQLVVNKIDLPAGWDWGQVPGAVGLSARTGEGLAELCRAITNQLVPDPPPPGAAVPFTAELAGRIDEAWRLWGAGNKDVRHLL